MNYLIRQCSFVGRQGLFDLRTQEGSIAQIEQHIPARPADTIVDAAGGALLPGLKDHHTHLLSLAASMASVQCGPPDVESEAQLRAVLAAQNSHDQSLWLRGTGYHPCVAGDIDRRWLDEVLPNRPARIQHRGGRLWVLNSPALAALGLFNPALPGATPPGVERCGGAPTGRLYECDTWLRGKLQSRMPDLTAASRRLASYGITDITDTTPHNGNDAWSYFRKSRKEGQLVQQIRMMGGTELSAQSGLPGLARGEFKVHLLESQLPDMKILCARMCAAHEAGRNIAVHCVSLTELVFTLACFEQVGVKTGDRIEHASVAPPAQVEKIAQLGLRVVTQPHFIFERGDQYLQEVAADEQPWLYRLRGFLDAGIPLAAGSDAPFGSPNPWQAMAAAVGRKTRCGQTMSSAEALRPEEALALYTSELRAPGFKRQEITAGARASLCLLKFPWDSCKHALSEKLVAATWCDGELVYNAVDEPPLAGSRTVDLLSA